MARTNVEVESLPRAQKVADILGVSLREVVGTMALLWMDSQEILKTHGSFEEIMDWSRLYTLEKADQERWLSALIRFRFLSLDGNQYKIHGNDVQIQSRVEKLDLAHKGGAATKARWEKIKASKIEAEGRTIAEAMPTAIAEAMPDAMPDGQHSASLFNAVQGNSIQCNSMQFKKVCEIEKIETPEKPPADLATAKIGKSVNQVIARYCELWKAKYNTPVSFSGKWTGNAKTLVKDHGLPKTIALVEAFLEMNDSWFLQKRHAFDLILTDLAKITHYAGTGVSITQTQINQVDKTLANKAAGEAAAAYFRNKGKQ